MSDLSRYKSSISPNKFAYPEPQYSTNLPTNESSIQKRKKLRNPQPPKTRPDNMPPNPPPKNPIKTRENYITLNKSLKKMTPPEITSQALCCTYHEDRRAAYFKLNSPKHKLCLDCSVRDSLLSFGETNEIIFSKEEAYRKHFSDIFLRRIEAMESNLDKLLDSIEKREIVSKQSYDGDQKLIDNFFQNFFSRINEIFQKFWNEKSAKIENFRAEIGDKKCGLLKYYEETKKYKVDVFENYEKIIKGMKLDSFSEIIEKYNSKLDIVQSNLENLSFKDSFIYEPLTIDPTRFEECNKILDSLLNHTSKIFEPTLNSNSSMSSLLASQLDSQGVKDEMKKINELFYSIAGNSNNSYKDNYSNSKFSNTVYEEISVKNFGKKGSESSFEGFTLSNSKKKDGFGDIEGVGGELTPSKVKIMETFDRGGSEGGDGVRVVKKEKDCESF
jgi:hypothetical protein